MTKESDIAGRLSGWIGHPACSAMSVQVDLEAAIAEIRRLQQEIRALDQANGVVLDLVACLEYKEDMAHVQVIEGKGAVFWETMYALKRADDEPNQDGRQTPAPSGHAGLGTAGGASSLHQPSHEPRAIRPAPETEALSDMEHAWVYEMTRHDPKLYNLIRRLVKYGVEQDPLCAFDTPPKKSESDRATYTNLKFRDSDTLPSCDACGYEYSAHDPIGFYCPVRR